MAALATAFVKIRADVSSVKNDTERGIDSADLGRSGERAGKNFSTGFRRGSESGLSDFAAAFSRPLGAVLSNLPAFALFTGAATAATASVVRLGAAIAPAVGVVAAVPAAGLAAAAAVGTLKLAFAGVGDALKAGLEGDTKKYAEATKGMAGQTRDAVAAVVALRPQLIALRTDVSGTFFAGFRADIQALAKAELPTMRGGLVGIAAELGQAGQRALEFGSQSQTVLVLRDALVQVRATIAPIGPSVQPILSIFRDLVAVGSIFLPSLTSGFAGAAASAATFVSNARQTGQLREFIQGGIDVLKQLGGILDSIGGIASSVFKAMQQGGGDALGALSGLLSVLDAVLNTAEAQQAMVAVFQALSTITQALGPAFAQVLAAVIPLVPPLAQLAATVGVALAQALISLTPLITSIVQRLADWITKLSENKGLFDGFVSAVSGAAGFLNDHLRIVGAVAAAYGAYRLALIANQAVTVASTAATAVATGVRQAHTVATALGTSTLGTWLGVKAIELGSWVSATAATIAGTVARAANTAALFIATGGLQVWLATKALELAAWIRSTASAVAATAATVAHGIAMGAVRVATIAWTAVQWLLNAALTANPIGIVVVAIGLLVAAILIAWNKSEGFRNVVLAVWAAIKTAILSAWEDIKAAWNALVNFITVMIPNAFNTGVGWIKAKWTEFKVGIQVEWLHVQAMWQALSRFITETIPAAFTAGVNWVKNKWHEFQVGIQVEWDRVRSIFEALGRFITETIPNAFNRGVEGIRNAWNRVREAARDPVAFVVNQVINPLIGGFNRVSKVFGGPQVATIGGFEAGGRIAGPMSRVDNRIARGPGGKALAVATGEFLVNAPQTAKFLPVLQAINSGRFPSGSVAASAYRDSYATGGLIGGLLDFGKDIVGAITDPAKALKPLVDAGLRLIPGASQLRDVLVGLGRNLANSAINKLKSLFSTGTGGPIGKWPSSPAAQRGDSGVWRSIVALINSTGPLSGSFGNAYRAGDPLWHGSGRAVDWMGYNQDALASFFMARRGSVLELIHRTNRRDYAVTRGVDKGSFNAALMEQHRNHIHIAMQAGGLVPQITALSRLAPIGYYGDGGVVPGPRGAPQPAIVHGGERVLPDGKVDLSDNTIAKLGAAIGQEINGVGRRMVQTVRAR